MHHNELTRIVIGHALDVHKKLGPGLLESTYKGCLEHVLRKAGLFVEREKTIPVIFDSVHLEMGYRLDFLIERKLVLEIKSVETLHEVHLAQVLTYLKLGGFSLGLLMNFNVCKLTDGIKRIVHNLEE